MVFRRQAGSAFTIAAMVLFAAAALAQESAAPANPAEPRESQPRAQRASTTAYKDGLLSVDLHDAPLSAVLTQVSTQARFAIVQVEDLSQERITIAFQNLPLEEGLHRLLEHYDSFLFYGVANDQPASVRAVWVYPAGRGVTAAPVPPEKWASTAELTDLAITLPDPNDRANAYQELIARGGPLAQDAVMRALGDPDDKVRALALNAATTNDVNVDAETLRQLLNDPSKDLRFLALHTLAGRTKADARAAAELLRDDQDPVIQRYARQILDQLAATPRQEQRAAPAPAPNRR